MMNINRKRIAAAFLTALIVLMILLTACAVVIEAVHDCVGEHCEICRLLGAITGVMRSLSYTAVVLSAVLVADIAGLASRFSADTDKRRATPVNEKVRLLN